MALASMSVLAAPTLISPAAVAVVSAPAALPCAPGTAEPEGRFAHDTATASTAVKEQVSRVAAAQTPQLGAGAARTSAAPLPSTVTIPVRIHIIRGTHAKDRKVTRDGARRLFGVLRGGFRGQQDPTMTSTGIGFDLRGITVSRNDRWFHATPGSNADKQMKRTLHEGHARTLNIYINNVHFDGGSLLGIAQFPWLVGRYPKQDGITVNVASLTGGSARGYNLGDTVIHEAGHWFGLFHTFEGEGDCEGPGDYVADTAPEAEPSFKCELTRDSCPTPYPEDWDPLLDPEPEPVVDPVQNFMDYSYDSCMNHFTPDQRTRAVALFMHYRSGR